MGVARRAMTFGEAHEGAKRTLSKPPPAPRPRHGKPIMQVQPPTAATIRQASLVSTVSSILPEPRSPDSDLNKPLPPPPASISASISASDSSRRSSITSVLETDSSTHVKRPPTPPLSRRRSQGPGKPSLSRSSPSFQSLGGISPSPSSSSSLSRAMKPPPPPPSRRASQRLSQSNNSSSLPYTSEETDPVDLSKPIMPQLNWRTSTATRTSVLSTANAAPLPPPPRRHRGSSSASQRPSLGAASASAAAGSSRSSVEGQRPPLQSTREGSAGSSRDILKDLASLQAEVDALRREGFRD